MHRLLFEKTENAVWISHLDLMRLFQRAFKRAGLHLTHTQGYNPRPSVSIALPMSVGVESICELLDFELDGDTVDVKEIPARLNDCLVPGVRVLSAYDNGRKVRDLSLMQVQVTLSYDGGVPTLAADAIQELFCRETLLVTKSSKKGTTEQDIIPMIRKMSVMQNNDKQIVLNVITCCQNPTLNPTLLITAVSAYLPEFAPDAAVCRRIEIFDNNETVFR